MALWEGLSSYYTRRAPSKRFLPSVKYSGLTEQQNGRSVRLLGHGCLTRVQHLRSKASGLRNPACSTVGAAW